MMVYRSLNFVYCKLLIDMVGFFYFELFKQGKA